MKKILFAATLGLFVLAACKKTETPTPAYHGIKWRENGAIIKIPADSITFNTHATAAYDLSIFAVAKQQTTPDGKQRIFQSYISAEARTLAPQQFELNNYTVNADIYSGNGIATNTIQFSKFDTVNNSFSGTFKATVKKGSQTLEITEGEFNNIKAN